VAWQHLNGKKVIEADLTPAPSRIPPAALMVPQQQQQQQQGTSRQHLAICQPATSRKWRVTNTSREVQGGLCTCICLG